ncbi:MAG: hypothetical protein A2073_05460 [Deltaproteobacteria bacterium GWC2_42_11]|nr:MAG: hypothetical protein A2073_05460 [Deltaproteobacteria bacterium GWC2_42_11]HBO83500.1 hypothetical protein [Deltaproteobacteria bacterium]
MNTALAQDKIDMYSHDLKKEAVSAVASSMEIGDERARCFGAKALGTINDNEAVTPLIKYLNCPDPDVRCDAALALGEIGSSETVPDLIQLLEDEEAIVRLSAIQALSRIGDKRAVEPLIHAITKTRCFSYSMGDFAGDYQWEIKERAAEALGIIKDKRAVEALIEALTDDDVDVMQGAIFRALIQQGDMKGIEAVAGYLKDKDVSVRRKAASAFTHADEPQVLEYLADAVIDEDSLVQTSAVQTIGKLGAEKDIVPLVLLLKDEDEEVRIESIKAIAKIIGNKHVAVKHILLLLNDKSSAVKKTAIELLGRISNPECIKPLIQVLNNVDDDMTSEAITALTLPSPQRGEDKGEGDFSVQNIKDAIISIIANNSRSPFVRNKALRLLKINEDKKGLNIVLEIIKDADADKSIRDSAFECLRRSGEIIAVDAVLELLNCEDANINISIAKLLKEFKDIKSERVLLGFLNDENGEIKKQAAVSLAYRGSDAGFEIITKIIPTLPEKGICLEEICDAVKNIKNENAVNFLVSCLKSKDPFLRYAAVKSVGSAGYREGVNSLIGLLDDENKDVRREAVIALSKIGNESVLILLVSRLYDYERFNNMRRDIALACKNINEAQTVKLILDTLNDKGRKDDHWTAIEALSVIYGSMNISQNSNVKTQTP